MTEIECPWFTETVACEMDGEYKIAHGWTQSTGQIGRYHYKPEEGWKFDQRYSDIRGLIGSHGGCHDCIMTLVHLITIDTVYVPPQEEPVYEPPKYEELPLEELNSCDGVVCEPVCYGVDRHETICEDGLCVKGNLIKANDPICGHVSPTPGVPNIVDFVADNKEIIALGTVAGILFLKYT